MKDKTYFLICLIGWIILILGIIVTTILLLSDDKEEEKENDEEEDESKEDWSQYDCYIFSIFWPPSSCFNKYSENDICFDRVRDLKIDNYFIIHGLWPSYISGKYIGNCNPNEDINITFNDEKYINKLTENWPGLYTSDATIWNHEYNKHGYCYIRRMGKNGETDYKMYFDKTVELLDKFHLIMELILPDTPKGLHNITKEKFKKFLSDHQQLAPSTYSLICSRNDTKKTDVLNEIRFNYDLDFNLINNIQSSENCPDNFQIYFSNETRKAVYEIFDFYIFSFLWNPTNCLKIGEECYKKVKNRELNILMIYGLWPSYSRGIDPQWCNIGEDINVEEFPSDLNYNMTNYWIGVTSTDKDFWTHEYNKHGYCYNQYYNQSVSNYSFYFQKVIDLYYQYDLKNFIKEIFPEVVPGLNYLNKTYIEDKLNEKFGLGTHTMICLKNSSEKYYLNEIRLKLDKNFNLTSKGITRDNCPELICIEILEADEGPQTQVEGFFDTYDMYFFTILWLGTTCLKNGEYCYDNIKDVPKNIFTIHGLWPNYKNGNLDGWCNGENDIEIDIHNETLHEFMNTHYVSGYHTNSYFWGHEYNKHGYCYNQRLGLDVNNYEIYFKKVMEIYNQYDFGNIFLDIYKDNIEPGNLEIKREEVQKYFKAKGFDKDTYLLVCTNITENNGTEIRPHILEIRVRFNLDFEILKNEADTSEFDCPEVFYAQFL